MKDLKERLRETRTLRGFTQEEIAEYLNCEVRTLQSYERGERKFPIDMIPQIVKKYDVSADYLFGLSDEMQPQAKEFQQSTGLSEASVSILQSIKMKENGSAILETINQLIENPLFYRLIVNANNVTALSGKTDRQLTEKGQQYAFAVSLENAMGNMNQVVTTGECYTEYLKLKVLDEGTQLLKTIMEGRKDNGKR